MGIGSTRGSHSALLLPNELINEFAVFLSVAIEIAGNFRIFVDTYLENGTFVVQIITFSGCRKLPIGSAVFEFEHLFIF